MLNFALNPALLTYRRFKVYRELRAGESKTEETEVAHVLQPPDLFNPLCQSINLCSYETGVDGTNASYNNT